MKRKLKTLSKQLDSIGERLDALEVRSAVEWYKRMSPDQQRTFARAVRLKPR